MNNWETNIESFMVWICSNLVANNFTIESSNSRLFSQSHQVFSPSLILYCYYCCCCCYYNCFSLYYYNHDYYCYYYHYFNYKAWTHENEPASKENGLAFLLIFIFEFFDVMVRNTYFCTQAWAVVLLKVKTNECLRCCCGINSCS